MPDLTPILTDAATLRRKLHEKAVAAVTSAFPLQLKDRTLEIKDVRVHAQEFSPSEQKQANLTGGSLYEPLKGTLVLKDAKGKVLDEARNFTMAHLPYLTERHTLLSKGNEYQVANQLRRKPGVYVQRADNGELKAVFNTGRGSNFDVTFNDQKGTFQLQYGTSNIPLYAALSGLGVSHDTIAKHLGAGVANVNKESSGHQVDKAVGKLYTSLEHPALLDPNATHEQKVEAIKKRYALATLDPDVTEATLGHAYPVVTPEAMLAAARKVLDVHRGKAHVDDTDSLTFKTFHALDDFMAERIRLQARQWAPKAKMALNGKTKIREALKPAPFSDTLKRFLTESSLAAVPTGINPMEIIDHAVKVTALGEGGIGSDRAIPQGARQIHNTHFGALDPIRTPESFHVGVDVRASIAAHRDDKGNLYTTLRNVRTGKHEFVRAGDLHKYTVAFPHQHLSGTVDAFRKGEIAQVPANEVTHQLDHVAHQYSPATTLIPMLHNIQGNRAIMGSKMGTQALPLLEREVPYVQAMSHLPGGESFETLYGHMIVPSAPVSGKVEKIDKDWVYIRPTREKKAEEDKEAADDLVKVPYQTHFPFPSKTHLHHTLDVKVGDKVEAGQRLGDSNYTRNGTLALGKNLLVSYLPYYGFNSNDAVVISEGCAKKLTSEHMYREVYALGQGVELSKAKHQLFYGVKYAPSQYAHLDEHGVVKKGARVNPKDLLVAGVAKTQLTGQDALLGRLSKGLVKPYKDLALVWDHGVPGEVIDVVQSSGQIAILIKTQESMQVGDKLAGRYGNKGVVSKIIPDHEMIQDEKGRPIDLLLTSAGVVSRINPAQVIETASGKVAEKTGKPIIYDNAENKDAVKWAKSLLREHGVKDKEHLYDPVLKRHIKGPDNAGVLVGRQYIYKLFKSTDTNFAGHGVGPYDLNEQPLKTGGDDSAKGIGKMEFDSLLAHNARGFLRESSTLRSQKNDEYWKAIQLGLPPPAPKPSFAFQKFVGMLEGAGVRVDKRASKFKVLPMTDKDILKHSSGSIENNKTLIAKNLKPEKGGLFDPLKTGGPQGALYSHIELHEPVPNPVFQEPIRRLLGLTEKGFADKVHEHGGAWFREQLKAINPKKKLAELRERMKKSNGAELNDLVKQVKYLEALQAEDLSPQEAYLLTKVPVIPPIFRPITPMINDPSRLMVADANKLYAHLMDANHTLKTTAVESDLGKHRSALYNAVGAVFGTDEVDNKKLQGQGVKGFLSAIAGVGTPKGGFFQRKLMRRTQDVSGRGTAVPDANLNMDQVGVPEQMLWQMLDKLVVARLVRKGYPGLQAREMVSKKDPAARAALMEETKERPVFINRAPTLHRWSIIAAYPVPVQGKTLRVSPFIEKGMNLDYDGDQQYAAVIIEVSRCIDDDLASWQPLMQEVPMTARFREQLGLHNQGHFYFVNLADFPHQEGYVQKEHIRFHPVPKGLRVVALDEATGQARLCEVSAWSFHAQREVEVVTLASKRQIVSDDDPRAVYGLNAALDYVRARPKDAVGMFVPLVQHVTFEEMVHSIKPPTFLHARAQRMLDEIPLTCATGRVLGTLVGDGWVIQTEGSVKGVALACLDDAAADVFARDLAKMFVEPPTVGRVSRCGGDFGSHVQSEKYQISCKQLGMLVEPLIGKSAKNKHLPPFFLSAPKAFRLGLFAGLMDTDGSIATSNGKSKPQTMVNFTSVSLRLCQETVWLAKSLGFNGAISATKTPQGGPCWQVTFSTPELHKLQHVPCANPEKVKRFTAFFAGPAPRSDLGGYTRQDPIPTPEGVAVRVAKCYKNASSGYTTFRRAVEAGFVSRHAATKALTEHPSLREEADPLLQRWVALVDNTAIRWDRVVSFERTGIKEDGYDLTVPGYETFMNVEGVVLSNTLQLHAPVTPEAVHEAKGLTMSSMLLSDQQRNKLMAFPQHEAIIGFTLAAKATGKGPVKTFKSRDELLSAWRRGELSRETLVEVESEKTASEEPEEERGWRCINSEEALDFFPPGLLLENAE